MDDKKAVVVGISGCSSSGKTTLARLLRDIFPNTFVLHQDDFYKPDDEIPVKDGLADWDCAEAISWPDMEAALQHIHIKGTFPVSSSPIPSPILSPSSSSSTRRLSHRSSHGCVSLPPISSPSPSPSSSNAKLTNQSLIASKEDQNTIPVCPVSDSAISVQKSKVSSWLQPGHPGHAIFSSPCNPLSVCLLDGFLLYTPSTPAVMSALDIKLFLLVSRAKATARREARDGYVTLEGFWKDPPGYVDRIVWPNYEAAHAWLFEKGDVQGQLREDVLEGNGIKAQAGKGLDVDMETTLGWAVDVIMRELERLSGSGEAS